MDLEARNLQPNVKAVLLAKLREYKSDLNNLKTEVKRIGFGNLNAAARDELLEAGMTDALMVCHSQYVSHKIIMLFIGVRNRLFKFGCFFYKLVMILVS